VGEPSGDIQRRWLIGLHGTWMLPALGRTLWAMRPVPTVALLACIALSACSTTPTPTVSQVRSPSVAEPSQSAVPIAWVRTDIDPNPGPVVVGAIASSLRVPDATVVAAVLGFEHRAGNSPYIWVFRADGVASAKAIQRWVSSEVRCPGVSQSTTLAGLATTVIRRKFVDQCQPEYLVALDVRTIAIIVDDGGYQGNAADATPVPYRPAGEIAQLVTWLQQNLPAIPLATGGPPQTNG
jgi:hypothetical protein